MARAKSKRFNHLISVISIVVFGLSIILIGSVSVICFNNYQENKRLEERYQQKVEEYETVKSFYDDTDEDGYYNVYSDGELVIYEVGGRIIID